MRASEVLPVRAAGEEVGLANLVLLDRVREVRRPLPGPPPPRRCAGGTCGRGRPRVDVAEGERRADLETSRKCPHRAHFAIASRLPPPPPPPASHVLTRPAVDTEHARRAVLARASSGSAALVRVTGIPGRHPRTGCSAPRVADAGRGHRVERPRLSLPGPYDLGWVNRMGRRTAPCTRPGLWTTAAVPALGAGSRAVRTGHSRTLVYWKSAAVDRRVIPFGSRIFMQALCSTPAPAGLSPRHRGAIGGAHIDIYRPPPAQLSGGAVLRGQAMLVVPPPARQRRMPRCP